MLFRYIGLFVAFCLLGTGCPDADPSLDKDGSATTNGVTCDDFIRHQRACGRIQIQDGTATEQELCATMTKMKENWRQDYFDTFFGCFVTHECEMDDDSCTGPAFRVAGQGLVDLASLDACMSPDASACNLIALGIMKECLSRQKACGGDGYADDLCFTIAAMKDGQRAQVPACLAKPCGLVGPCLKEMGAFSY